VLLCILFILAVSYGRVVMLQVVSAISITCSRRKGHVDLSVCETVKTDVRPESLQLVRTVLGPRVEGFSQTTPVAK